MKLFRFTAAMLGLAVSAAAVPAAACSLGPAYQVPTNLELARDAEVIVLAQVVGGSMNTADPEASTITIRPAATLKGNVPAGDITLRGMLLAGDVGRESNVLSNPYEFKAAHPVSYWGACIRYVFPQGTNALFFLKQGADGAWVPSGGPFSRWAEDVPGMDAPWVELSRLYVRAAGLPDAERIALLESARDSQRARQGDPLAQLVAADIDRVLKGQGGTAGLFEDSAQTESTVASTLEKMRKAAIEAGN
ncbi:hypothetical protein [Altererythrobacter sp. Root672]|uniref:hypothetical protein n=1 Tax=Altererythrobacter sp. Root672 TaxID=1736584 RepID=UPI0006FCE9DE|nr:hypothetical protein [Altererythrobacter sp. Root672]KRA80709.1 hypothetical protein ASD76_16350 [Altererythrobacter sp. Root672]